MCAFDLSCECEQEEGLKAKKAVLEEEFLRMLFLVFKRIDAVKRGKGGEKSIERIRLSTKRERERKESLDSLALSHDTIRSWPLVSIRKQKKKEKETRGYGIC